MQNSGAEDQEKIDQRKHSSMEDSTVMTVEFLRARLLSERSVSRTARQRADQLAKKVVELEEQIKIVTLQRKKAEKALAEVLAVLDSHGVDELSECFNSDCDHEEVLYESKESNSSVKDEDHSISSKSGSELEVSPNQGRSLSWKQRSNAPDSFKKKNFGQARRRHNSFMSNGGTSPKHRSGKSCRQIKRRDTISTGEDGMEASFPVNAQGNGQATGSGDVSHHSKNRPENEIEDSRNKEQNAFSEFPDSNSVDNQSKENSVGLHANANYSDRDAEMERALEEQAQLIDQYEAEENAQREWEEKFQENNGGILDSYKLGNQSDVTEERSELKVETGKPIDAASTAVAAEVGLSIPSEQEHKPHANESHASQEPTTQTLSITAPMGPTTSDHISLHVDLESLPDQQQGRIHIGGHESIFQGPAFPGQEQARDAMETKQNLGWPRNITGFGLHSELKLQPLSYGSSGDEPTQMSSSFPGDGAFSGGEMPGSQNQRRGSVPVTSNSLGGVLNSSQIGGNFAEGESLGTSKEILKVGHQTSGSMGGVLEALQLAKQSLQHELKRVASPSHGTTVTVPDTQVQAIKDANAVDTPFGPAGLFRLPSQSQSISSYRPDYFRTYSDFGSNSTRHGSNSGFGVLSSTRHGSDVISSTSHGSDSGFGVFSHERYPTSPYSESASRISSYRRYHDPCLDSARSRIPSDKLLMGYNPNPSMGMPADRRSPFQHMDLKTRLPSGEGLPRSYFDSRTGMPPNGPYSLHGDSYIWDLHRQ